jgi:ketopantoate reductase
VLVLNKVPDIAEEGLQPYDFIVLATKNIPDISPNCVDIISPALPKDNTHTALVLLQNGLNIEKSFLEKWPRTPILSGVSLIGSAQPNPGRIVQDGKDMLYIGAFEHQKVGREVGDARAREFVNLYSKGGKTQCTYRPGRHLPIPISYSTQYGLRIL